MKKKYAYMVVLFHKDNTLTNVRIGLAKKIKTINDVKTLHDDMDAGGYKDAVVLYYKYLGREA